ncbi:hypothetical protein CLM62_36460 [Streptomyces sp. SA15]|nr:hypothetical protein CLM62_36460 [Streptomyces sp. SA15]
MAGRVRPDVVVMDIRMPHTDGVSATRQIMSRPDPPAVLALTTFDLDEYLFGVLRAGAAGTLLLVDPEQGEQAPTDSRLGVRVVQ